MKKGRLKPSLGAIHKSAARWHECSPLLQSSMSQSDDTFTDSDEEVHPCAAVLASRSVQQGALNLDTVGYEELGESAAAAGPMHDLLLGWCSGA